MVGMTTRTVLQEGNSKEPAYILNARRVSPRAFNHKYTIPQCTWMDKGSRTLVSAAWLNNTTIYGDSELIVKGAMVSVHQCRTTCNLLL